MDAVLDALHEKDWQAVRSIYLEGIATGDATFETKVPHWKKWNKGHLMSCRLIARMRDQVVGWAALSPVSRRCAYAGVAEVSIYITASWRGKGIGRLLMQALIDASEKEGIWTLQSSMFPENGASLRLHESCGFRQVGIRERISRLKGTWRDTIIMERRSHVVGL